MKKAWQAPSVEERQGNHQLSSELDKHAHECEQCRVKFKCTKSELKCLFPKGHRCDECLRNLSSMQTSVKSSPR